MTISDTWQAHAGIFLSEGLLGAQQLSHIPPWGPSALGLVGRLWQLRSQEA